ncbi:MAG: folate family ECF transporter S component, partial [Enterococcus sp.]|nr:folate family ECF transporter S component [Enterococcus sp.]
MNLDNNREQIYIAVLTALQIILGKYLGIKTPLTEMSLSFLPLAVTAVLFGIGPAVISAVIADVVGFMLFPVGTFFLGFTLSGALSGMIYGYSFYKRKIGIVRIALTCLIVSVFISLFLNTYWLYILTGKSIAVLL